MTKTKRCPICRAQYRLISESEKVCQSHENWFVTVCLDCGQTSFSDCVGLCMKCSKRRSRGVGSKGINKDHRAALREYGQEGWK